MNFNLEEKIGEGTYGQAHKVSSNQEGGIQRAVKKTKERYQGMNDRNNKLQEVSKAFQICPIQE